MPNYPDNNGSYNNNPYPNNYVNRNNGFNNNGKGLPLPDEFVPSPKMGLYITLLIFLLLFYSTLTIIFLVVSFSESAAFMLFLPPVITLAVMQIKRAIRRVKNCKDYGDIDLIYNRVAARPVYADYRMMTDGNFIISRNKLFVCRCNEVLNVHLEPKMTKLCLNIANKYGERLQFTYKNSYNLTNIVVKLRGLCKNSTFGYTPENMYDIKKRKIRRF